MFKGFTPKMKNVKTIEYKSDMLLGVRDKPDVKSWIVLAIQHVFAMFGATVLIPLLINSGAITNGAASGTEVIPTSIALFSSGIGTLIYIAVTRAKVPIYLGSSAAYVGMMASMYPMYGNGMFMGLLGVGVIYLAVSLAIYLFGTGWLKKLLPPVVVGPMIMVIGLSLAGIAINNIFTADINAGGIVNGTTWNIDWWGLGVAVITVASAMLIALLMRGRMKLMPILGAMIIGTVIALIISTWHHPSYAETNPDGTHWTNHVWDKYNQTDWGTLKTYLAVPDFSKSIFAGHIMTGTASGAKWSFMPFVLMMPVAFATIAEHIGDHTVLGKITGRDYINGAPGLHATLAGDGLATMFGGLIGGPANTSYGENTTTVGLSKVGSVYVTGTAACVAVGMSFIGIIPTFLSFIPQYVSGGLELVLFGFIASNGLKVLVDDKINMHEVRNVFIISTMLLIGIGGAALGWTMNNQVIKFSGTSVAMVSGMILNGLLPHDRGIDMNKMPKVQGKPHRSDKQPKNVDEQNMF